MFGPSVLLSDLLCLLLTSDRLAPLFGRNSLELTSPNLSDQISPGNARYLPVYACRIYVTASVLSIGLWESWLSYPAVMPHMRFLFVKPTFCPLLSSDSPRGRHPCIRLTVPLCRARKGLSPSSIRAIPGAPGSPKRRQDNMTC